MVQTKTQEILEQITILLGEIVGNLGDMVSSDNEDSLELELDRLQELTEDFTT